MSIRLRFLLVLGLLLGAFGAELYLLREAENRQIRMIVEAARAESRVQLRSWVGVLGLPLRDFIRDFSVRPDVDRQSASPGEAWLREQLQPALSNYPLQAIWLLGPDGLAVRTVEQEPGRTPPALPPREELRARAAPGGRWEFFAETESGVWQLCGAPLPSGGWLFAAQRWDGERLERLARLTESRVHWREVSARAGAAPPAGAVSVPFRDWRDRPVRELLIEQDLPDLAGWIEWDGHVIRLFIAFGLLLLVAIALAVRLWVLHPLSLISESLARQSSGPIAPLLRRSDEFRRIAGLVETAFADQRALAREVVERRQVEAALRATENNLRHSIVLRGRLARDLHDNVIQSLYAAGLGLADMRERMTSDPFGIQDRLQNCLQSLNDTIRQVRRYIGDLEPDPAEERQPFSQAVRALADTMQGLWPVEISTELDDSLARRMTAMTELHCLQILRECISNAVRHGAAARIGVRLFAENGETVLEIRDDGCGFDPQRTGGTGRGLANLNARATEIGAALRLDSAPGRGTTITLRLPPGVTP